MAVFYLKYITHEKRTGDTFDLDGELTLVKNENFHVMAKKLIEDGRADDYFDDYIADPELSVKEWFDDDANAEDVNSAAQDWFNDECDCYDYSSAREFYNSTISRNDIEVTIDRDYFVKLSGDTFLVHVNDTWDELYRNEEAIQLAKSNFKLGQTYLEKYFSEDSDEKFKLDFERITGYKFKFGVDPEKLRKADPETLDDFDKDEKENLRDNMEFIVEENQINWATASD